MKRHGFDALSAFFGLVFTGAALLVMLTEDVLLDVNSQWVWPVLILVAGFALIASGFRWNRESERESVSATDGSVLPGDPFAD